MLYFSNPLPTAFGGFQEYSDKLFPRGVTPFTVSMALVVILWWGRYITIQPLHTSSVLEWIAITCGNNVSSMLLAVIR